MLRTILHLGRKVGKINTIQTSLGMIAVWEKPCERCTGLPPDDDEFSDLIAAIKSGQLSADELIYRCAWRPSGKCAGFAQRVALGQSV